MDEDDDMGWWWAHDGELHARYELEQKLLRDDPAYEEWLNSIEQENAYADHR